jgi:outer membrane protein insertion porin family
LHPTAGQRFIFSQDFAGLGGNVHYLKSRAEAAKYWSVLGNFTFSVSAEGGYVIPFKSSSRLGDDPVRLVDRYYLGEPELRGFDIRGVGPRVIREFYNSVTKTFQTATNQVTDDALGGRAYYKGRAELEIPLGSGAKSLGLRPSIFMDIGSVFKVNTPILTTATDFTDPADGTIKSKCRNAATGALTFAPAAGCDVATQSTIAPFRERFVGNSFRPRLSVGFGVNWNSPFGPFRIDIAKALLKEPGDQTKLFTFNVGTQF